MKSKTRRRTGAVLILVWIAVITCTSTETNQANRISALETSVSELTSESGDATITRFGLTPDNRTVELEWEIGGIYFRTTFNDVIAMENSACYQAVFKAPHQPGDPLPEICK